MEATIENLITTMKNIEDLKEEINKCEKLEDFRVKLKQLRKERSQFHSIHYKFSQDIQHVSCF